MNRPRVLLDSQQVQDRVRELGMQITADHRDHPLLVIGVLTGCFIFMADLLRHIETEVRCDFLGLASYGAATESSGEVSLTKDLSAPVRGEHVLVVEDIVDTGLTIRYLMDNLGARSPRSVQVAALLSKPARRRVEVDIDYLGFTIEDRFVVGYGMDHAGRYRNLPYVGVLED